MCACHVKLVDSCRCCVFTVALRCRFTVVSNSSTHLLVGLMSKTMMEAKEWLRNHTNRTWHVKGDGTVVENDSTVRSSNSEAALRAGTEFQYDVDMGERTAALTVGGVLIHTFRNLPREGVVPYAMFGGSDQVLRLQRAARHKFVMYSRGPGVPLAGLMPTCESVEVVEGFQRARLTPTSSSELAAGVHLLTRLAPIETELGNVVEAGLGGGLCALVARHEAWMLEMAGEAEQRV